MIARPARYALALGLALVGCEGSGSPAGSSDPGEASVRSSLAAMYSAEYYGLEADDLTECLKIGDPRCPLRPPSPEERAALLAAISTLNCGGLQAIAMQALDQGRLEMFDTWEGNWGDSHRGMDLMHVWSGTVWNGLLAETIAHEAGHLSNKVVSKEISEIIAVESEVICGTRPPISFY